MTAERIVIERRRKIVVGLIALLAALALFAVTAQNVNATNEPPTQGQCGDKLTWAYDKQTKVLTISGKGDMYDYDENPSDWRFHYKKDVEKVVVGEGVTRIGNEAFVGLSKLSNAELPTTLLEIGNSAFMEVGDHDWNGNIIVEFTVTLPDNLQIIGASAFSGSTITNIKIPKGVKKLERTFQGAAFIETIDLGEVEEIGEFTFENCWNLQSVTLPKTLKVIGIEAFTGVGLTEIIIPEGVTSIGGMWDEDDPAPAFQQCENLKRIVLPSTLTFISEGEFKMCDNLEEIDFRGTEAQWKQLTAGIDPTSPLGEILKDSKIKVVYDYDTNIHINGDPDTPSVQANPMTVTGKTVKVKRKKLKKKAQTISAARAFTVNNAQGMVTYQKVSVGSKKVNKKYGKKIKINSSTGKITVKKGLKKGTYKVKVNVSAAGNAGYYPLTRTTVVKIKVK